MDLPKCLPPVRRLLAASLLIVAPLLMSGCASTGGSSSSRGDIISEEEIEKWGPTFSSAYQMVEQLRPHWLQKRGTVSLSPGSSMVDYIVIYEDRNRMGDPEALKTIAAQNVKEIQRYTTGEAIQFGPPDHPHGAIVVRTKTGF